MVIRRLRYIILGTFQVKLLVLLIVAMILPALVVGVSLYYLIFVAVAEEIGSAETIGTVLFPAIHKVNVILTVVLPVLFLLLLVIGVVLSHRIAGPAYRLEKELTGIAKGDFSVRIKLRKRDDPQFKSIADKMNGVLDEVQRRLGR